MSETDDERDQRPDSLNVDCRDVAVNAGVTSWMLGLIPCAIIFSLATRTSLGQSIFVAIWLGLAVAWMAGECCGLIGWWLTRNSTVDSRVMACALAVIVELTLLGWMIVIFSPPVLS